MIDRHPGGCECGAFRYVLTGPPIVIYACHCTICQTQSGSAFGMAMRIHEQDFEIVAGESARGIMALTMDGIAIGNGILTTENEAQAIYRADPAQANKGAGAAEAAMTLLALQEKFA